MTHQTLTSPNPMKPSPIWLLIMAYLFAIIVLFALNSCSCDYHIKRAKLKCGYTTKSDTVWRKDTTYIHEVTKDTVFNYFQRDTVVVREGRLTMKYFYNTHDSTVYLSGKCDTVFIVKNVPTVVNTTEIKESVWPILLNIFKLLVAIMCAVGLYKLIKSK